MTKRIIALLLALASAAVLLAGCELRLGPPKTFEIPEMPVLSVEDLALLKKLSEDGDNKALDDLLGSLMPPGYTLAAEQAVAVQPNLLPQGETIDKAEVLKLVKKVQDIFNSGTFYLKGQGNNMMDNTGGAYAPLTLAVDQDKMMMETQFDWNNMMGMAFQEQGKEDLGQSKMQAGIARTALGSTMRMLFVENAVYMVYPEKKFAANLSQLSEEEEDFNGLSREMIGMFSQFGSANPEMENMQATKVKQGKNEYLCATLLVDQTDADGKKEGTSTVKYYFLKGDLKRLEVTYAATAQGESGSGSSVFEIEEFSGKVDSSFFSTRGYTELNMGDMAKLTGLLNF